MKKGHIVDYDTLGSKLDLPKIEIHYWEYIISNLYDEGYITVEEIQFIDEDESSRTFHILLITPKGIEYLIDNSMMKKAKDVIKGTMNIIK